MSEDLRRQRTGELELGVTEATQKHFNRKVVRAPPASPARLAYEKRRPKFLREMAAEATGVFFYVFPGVAATASLFFASANAAAPATTAPNAAVYGSILNVAFAFGFGIAFAIITSASVSGGHFNPAITVCFVIFQGFPIRKAIRYIFAQIFGAFLAGLFIYGMWHQQIAAVLAEGVPAEELIQVFCAYPLRTQSLGYLFFIEFFVDSFIGLIIWSVLDPANPFVSPAGAPFTIGLAYTTMVVAFANITISTNLARDLGTRMVAAAFLSTSAFSYKSYSWIGILVNVPATVFAVTYYEFIFKDTMTHISEGHLSHPDEFDNDGSYEEKDTSALGGTRLGRFLSNRHSGGSADMQRPNFSNHSAQ